MERKKHRKRELTIRERLFCKYYLGESNFVAAHAASAAGYSAKWSNKIGYEELQKPHIQEYLAFLLKRVEKKLDITIEKKIDLLWRAANRCYGLTDEELERVKKGETITTPFNFNVIGLIAAVAEMNKMQDHYPQQKQPADSEADTEKLTDEIKKYEREC